MRYEGEEWRPIDGFPAYAVSNHGRIMRVTESTKGHLPKVLKPWLTPQGYAVVTVSNGDSRRRMQVSRLVCAAFHGPAPSPEHQAAHNDGCPGHDSAANLRWATRIENMADCLKHGTRATGDRHGRATKPESTPRGEAHGGARLTKADVIAIRQHPKTIGSGRSLAARYGVSPAAICAIRSKKIWRHL